MQIDTKMSSRVLPDQTLCPVKGMTPVMSIQSWENYLQVTVRSHQPPNYFSALFIVSDSNQGCQMEPVSLKCKQGGLFDQTFCLGTGVASASSVHSSKKSFTSKQSESCSYLHHPQSRCSASYSIICILGMSKSAAFYKNE